MEMTEQMRIKKSRKSNIYLMILVVCIMVLSIKANIVNTIQFETQLDTIAAKDLTIVQLNEQINLISFKLEQTEKSILRLKTDLITLQNVLKARKIRYTAISIDSLSIIRSTDGDIIKIGE